jgi:hypothetical protein
MELDAGMVHDLLDVEEPDYVAAAELGDAVIPFLIDLVDSSPPLLAQKATALASRIPSEGALLVITKAATRPEPAVRVAAAAALGDLMDVQRSSTLADSSMSLHDIDAVLAGLLLDADEGVRRFAEESAATRRTVVPSAEVFEDPA